MSMATSRVSHVIGILICITLLLLFVSEGLFGSFSSMSIKPFPSPVISSLRPGRRAFVVSKFDFTPFKKDLRRKNPQDVSQLGGSEIDPRYGVEKRLVPSGPNPLHH
ncbi:unnamed protein product [Eruca vesicaria subsp. sativa]|uniref:Uncharacterized protein n=1 Tax=Eruca vesicaria subsp. sativa TaxID=29727 RepID=A0ABC8KKS2_ERUVS|nr:unnamed protein product [Eruca vesicaria subsp. sativa]